MSEYAGRIKNMIEDYQRKINSANGLLDGCNESDTESIVRLKSKKSAFSIVIRDLKAILHDLCEVEQ